MKITKAQLRQIIKEELEVVVGVALDKHGARKKRKTLMARRSKAAQRSKKL